MSSSDPSLGPTQRWRLDIAYDGAAFSGFAFQPQFNTVTGVLRATLASTLHLSEEPIIVGAGRTDAGVHAFAQVVHVDLPVSLFKSARGPEPARLARSLNKQLRGRIRVLRAMPVGADFHARFSATWREYRYLVLDTTPPALALSDAWSWAVQGPLDVGAMNAAASEIIGTHDFRAFCRRPTNTPADPSLRRHVLLAHWERLEDPFSLTPSEDSVLRLRIRAQSFCHNMVRCLVSCMVATGQGRIAQNTLKERLSTLQRDHLPSPAPAAGLSLVGVGYDEFAGGPSGFVR